MRALDAHAYAAAYEVAYAHARPLRIRMRVRCAHPLPHTQVFFVKKRKTLLIFFLQKINS
jgi:hypothetical protein